MTGDIKMDMFHGMQLNSMNQATVQDGRVVVQNIQGRKNRRQGNNARGIGAAGYDGAHNRVGNANPSQARQIKCYNLQTGKHRVRHWDEELSMFIAAQSVSANRHDKVVNAILTAELATNKEQVELKIDPEKYFVQGSSSRLKAEALKRRTTASRQSSVGFDASFEPPEKTKLLKRGIPPNGDHWKGERGDSKALTKEIKVNEKKIFEVLEAEVVQIDFWYLDSGSQNIMSGDRITAQDFHEKVHGQLDSGMTTFVLLWGYGDYEIG
ncbi:hypothetical protein Tco_0600157 [Tanacetum coccineum]|uniref:Uncharacterized protein n=1 Tax=Tanacetum coccineum TaxID=301880 RepID=A0ABQ4WB03_9ASTR